MDAALEDGDTDAAQSIQEEQKKKEAKRRPADLRQQVHHQT